MSNAIVTLESLVYGVAEVFDQVLVDRSINFKREAEFALQILYGNDYLNGIAMKNPQSLRDAVTNIAAIGISLNPARKLAYLVPRDHKVCLDISYMGLVEIATASGSTLWVQGSVVYETESFHLNGLDKIPTHDRNPFAKEKGEIVGAYVVAKTHSGDYLTTTMSAEEINAIRDRSSAWKAWVEKKKRCPWVTDYVPMALKTVIKSASKLWPKSERLDQAIHYLNTDGGQGIEFAQGATEQAIKQPPAAPQFSLGNILARLDAAESDADINAVRSEGLRHASEARDKVAYDRIRAAVTKRRLDLGVIIDQH